MIVTRLSYWNCLIWGYLRLNHLIFWGKLRFRNVGDCGEMWGIVGWQGDISDFGMWAIWRVRTAGCAIFHKFWHFQKFFNFNIFSPPHFCAKKCYLYIKMSQNPLIFLTLCKFSVCASVTLCHIFPSFTLQNVRITVTHLSNAIVIGGIVLKIIWFIAPQSNYPIA